MTIGKHWEAHELPLDDVRTHKSLQNRADGLDAANVNRIRRALAAGEETRDPIRVARVGKAFYVVDGFHRCEAYLEEGRHTIPALVAKMSLQEAQEYARKANAANGKPLSRADKEVLWQTYVAEGRHLDDDGIARSSREIARDLGYIWAHETVRKKLKALGIEMDEVVEFPGGYKPRDEELTEQDLEELRTEEAEDAIGALAGLLPTLDSGTKARLISATRKLLDALEQGEETTRLQALEALRHPLDI